MDVLNTAFYEPEEEVVHCCFQCDSVHMETPYETTFCSQDCYTAFFDFINTHEYTYEPVECQIFVRANDEYDPDAHEYEYEYEDDEDNMSCASDDTVMSIYTYVRVGKKRYTKQLKARVIVKVSEKYGSAYDTGTV